MPPWDRPGSQSRPWLHDRGAARAETRSASSSLPCPLFSSCCAPAHALSRPPPLRSPRSAPSLCSHSRCACPRSRPVSIATTADRSRVEASRGGGGGGACTQRAMSRSVKVVVETGIEKVFQYGESMLVQNLLSIVAKLLEIKAAEYLALYLEHDDARYRQARGLPSLRATSAARRLLTSARRSSPSATCRTPHSTSARTARSPACRSTAPRRRPARGGIGCASATSDAPQRAADEGPAPLRVLLHADHAGGRAGAVRGPQGRRRAPARGARPARLLPVVGEEEDEARGH